MIILVLMLSISISVQRTNSSHIIIIGPIIGNNIHRIIMEGEGVSNK
jgi:hypothetical protein